MGATGFSTSSHIPNLQEAFRAAQEQAVFEYGADSYNGTISTVQSCQQVVENPVPLAVAESMQDVLWDRLSKEGVICKWDSCAAIPFADESDFISRDEEVVFEIQSPNSYPMAGELRSALEEAYERSPGEMLGAVRYDVEKNTPTVLDREVEQQERFIVFWGLSSRTFSSEQEAVEFAHKMGNTPVRIAQLPEKVRAIQSTENLLRIRARFRVFSRQQAKPKTVGWCFFGLAAE